MAFRMDFEYILRGYMFRKGRMKITVSKIFKVGDIDFVCFFFSCSNYRLNIFCTDDGGGQTGT